MGRCAMQGALKVALAHRVRLLIRECSTSAGQAQETGTRTHQGTMVLLRGVPLRLYSIQSRWVTWWKEGHASRDIPPIPMLERLRTWELSPQVCRWLGKSRSLRQALNISREVLRMWRVAVWFIWDWEAAQHRRSVVASRPPRQRHRPVHPHHRALQVGTVKVLGLLRRLAWRSPLVGTMGRNTAAGVVSWPPRLGLHTSAWKK